MDFKAKCWQVPDREWVQPVIGQGNMCCVLFILAVDGLGWSHGGWLSAFLVPLPYLEEDDLDGIFRVRCSIGHCVQFMMVGGWAYGECRCPEVCA